MLDSYLWVHEGYSQILHLVGKQLSAANDLAQGSKLSVYVLHEADRVVALKHYKCWHWQRRLLIIGLYYLGLNQVLVLNTNTRSHAPHLIQCCTWTKNSHGKRIVCRIKPVTISQQTWLRFFHRLSIGPSSAAHKSLSNFVALASERLRTRSCMMTLLLMERCDERSIFSGRPKYAGESNSGRAWIDST